MKLTHELLSKHTNIPITMLVYVMAWYFKLGDSYVLNLSLTSYEPNRDICSAIGLTTRPLSSVMSWAYCVSLVWYVRHMPCLNVYLESHACYEELFKLIFCYVRIKLVYSPLLLHWIILNMLQVDEDDAKKRSSVDA